SCQGTRSTRPITVRIGGASRDRTDDLIVANDALSQLSYSPTALIWDELILAAAARNWEPHSRGYNHENGVEASHHNERDGPQSRRSRLPHALGTLPPVRL